MATVHSAPPLGVHSRTLRRARLLRRHYARQRDQEELQRCRRLLGVKPPTCEIGIQTDLVVMEMKTEAKKDIRFEHEEVELEKALERKFSEKLREVEKRLELDIFTRAEEMMGNVVNEMTLENEKLVAENAIFKKELKKADCTIKDLKAEVSSLNEAMVNDADALDENLDEIARCHNSEIKKKDENIAAQDKVIEALRKEISRLKPG